MKSRSTGTGALLGIAGGVAGLVAMRYAMKGSQELLQVREGDRGRPDTVSFVKPRRRRGESPSTALGRAIFTTVMRHEPSRRQKETMGYAVHWGFGLALASGYGMLRGRDRHPLADLTGGALFGVGLWGVSDELLTPLLGYGDRPGAISMKQHAQALIGHVGYGVATATTVQGLGRLLDTLESRRSRGGRLLPSSRAKDVRERLAARFSK